MRLEQHGRCVARVWLAARHRIAILQDQNGCQSKLDTLVSIHTRKATGLTANCSGVEEEKKKEKRKIKKRKKERNKNQRKMADSHTLANPNNGILASLEQMKGKRKKKRKKKKGNSNSNLILFFFLFFIKNNSK